MYYEGNYYNVLLAMRLNVSNFLGMAFLTSWSTENSFHGRNGAGWVGTRRKYADQV
jgi:hypothetical protein